MLVKVIDLVGLSCLLYIINVLLDRGLGLFYELIQSGQIHFQNMVISVCLYYQNSNDQTFLRWSLVM